MTAPAPPQGRRGRRGVIDSYDLTLMDLLTIDGRASTKHLAEQVGLTDATVAARLRELTDRNVLRVRAVVDWDLAGLKAPIVFFIRVHGRSVRGVAEELLQAEQVHSVCNVFGSSDLVVRVLLADRTDAMVFEDETLGAIDGVEIVMSLIDVDVPKHANDFHTGNLTVTELPTFPETGLLLDDIDRKLIECLVDDARQSLRQIGRLLDVSEHTVRARLRRLEDKGLVKICAQIDPVAAGSTNEYAYIALRAHHSQVGAVIEKLVARPEFTIVTRTVGEYNVLGFVTAASRAHLVDIVDALRATGGIERSETWPISSIALSAFPWGRF